jgi:hypothetical protein
MSLRPLFLAMSVFAGVALLSTTARAKSPPREILGVSIGMSFDDAQKHLANAGKPTKDESGPQGAKQIWQLDHPRFSYLIVSYDDEQKVAWLTAFAKKTGKPMRYRDVGNLQEARVQGRYFYFWTVKDKDGDGYIVRAAGTDSERLETLSLFAPGSESD